MRRIKRSSRPTRKHWGSFCKSTSIHGMRYLVEPGHNSLLDKLWWSLVVALGLLTAAYYASRQYVKWRQSPIDADNSDDKAYLWEVPFPAFTICDNRKINATLQKNASYEDRNLMYLLCGDDRISEFQYNEQHLFDLIPPLKLKCELQLIDSASPLRSFSPCEKMVMRILTDQGVCYTFNMIDPALIFKDGVEHGHSYHGRKVDWDMINGYRGDALLQDTNLTNAFDTGPFPKRANNALFLDIYHENNTTPQYCYGDKDGFRVILHNPDEFPMVGNRENPWISLKKQTVDKYIVLPPFTKVLIDFKARRIVPSENLVQFEARQRKCYFPGEKPLAYFRIYSYSNCQLECLTNLTKQSCNCIDYYMPRLVLPGEPENSTHVCSTFMELKCFIYSYDFWDRTRDRCNCYPSCTTIEYETIAWYSDRESDKPVGKGEFEGLLASEIIVYSTEEEYVKSERRATYTRVDFIADCGGVFGLFCGMSIISIVEFMYYGFLWIIGRRSDKS